MSDVSIIVACCEIQHRRRVFGARPKLATASNGVPEKHNPARNRLRLSSRNRKSQVQWRPLQRVNENC